MSDYNNGYTAADIFNSTGYGIYDSTGKPFKYPKTNGEPETGEAFYTKPETTTLLGTLHDGLTYSDNRTVFLLKNLEKDISLLKYVKINDMALKEDGTCLVCVKIEIDNSKDPCKNPIWEDLYLNTDNNKQVAKLLNKQKKPTAESIEKYKIFEDNLGL